jgi:hypothetical protein
MLLYYRLMTKWSGLGDSTELSRVGLSQYVLTFNILAQVLIDYSFLNEQATTSISCAIQLIKHQY